MAILEFRNNEVYLDGVKVEIVNRRRLSFPFKNITAVIGEIPDDLEVLDLSNNRLTEFNQDLNDLRLLNLANNLLTEFTQYLNNLEKLFLGDNQLTEFKQDPNNLEGLYLKNNPIILPDGTVPDLSNITKVKNYQTELSLQLRDRKVKSARK